MKLNLTNNYELIQFVKSKPLISIDAVIVGYTEGTGKFKGKAFGALLVALMNKEKNFVILSNVGTGYTEDFRKELYQKLKKIQADGDKFLNINWVSPKIVIEVVCEETLVKLRPTFSYKKGYYKRVEDDYGATLRKPRFVRIRNDKSVNPTDLRLTQIPSFIQRVKSLQREGD